MDHMAPLPPILDAASPHSLILEALPAPAAPLGSAGRLTELPAWWVRTSAAWTVGGETRSGIGQGAVTAGRPCSPDGRRCARNELV